MPGLISRDVHRWDADVLEQFTVKELIGMCKKAAELLMNGTLPVGDAKQTFDDYIKSSRRPPACRTAIAG